MQISISFYELLTTLKYSRPLTFPIKGCEVKATFFSLFNYMEKAAALGIKRMRFFADLNFFWNARIQKAVWNPEACELLYPYDDGYEFNTVNPTFKSALDILKGYGNSDGIEYLICGATQGPDYGSMFFPAMGYPHKEPPKPISKSYYDQANFAQYKDAFPILKQYFKDLWTQIYKVNTDGNLFKYAECYNEGDPGMEELAAFKPGRLGLQLIMPRIVPNGVSIDKLRRLGVKRFCWHGVFTPSEVSSLVSQAKSLGISPGEIELSTDGATPWRNPDGSYRFTYLDREYEGMRHYDWRKYWNTDVKTLKPSAVNKQSVIDAHRAIRDRCAALKVAVVDFQSVLKWSSVCEWFPDAEEWVEKILH